MSLNRFLQRLKHSPGERERIKNISIISSAVIIIMIVAFLGLRNASVTGAHSIITETAVINESSEIPSFENLDINAMEYKLYLDVSEYRIKNELDGLEKSAKLEAIAKEHSQDMADKNYLSHETPLGEIYLIKYGQVGLSCAFHGENILKTTDPENLLQQLLNDESNQKNLLHPGFEKQGIGIAVKDAVYVTQDFCG